MSTLGLGLDGVHRTPLGAKRHTVGCRSRKMLPRVLPARCAALGPRRPPARHPRPPSRLSQPSPRRPTHRAHAERANRGPGWRSPHHSPRARVERAVKWHARARCPHPLLHSVYSPSPPPFVHALKAPPPLLEQDDYDLNRVPDARTSTRPTPPPFVHALTAPPEGTPFEAADRRAARAPPQQRRLPGVEAPGVAFAPVACPPLLRARPPLPSFPTPARL